LELVRVLVAHHYLAHDCVGVLFLVACGVQLTFWHHLGGNFESIRNLAILLASIDIPNHSTVCIGIDVVPNFWVKFVITLLPFVDMGSITKGVKLHRPF